MSLAKLDDFSNLQSRIRRFTEQRDWQQFHSAKNLSMALGVEAAEIMEHFMWLSQSESDTLESGKLEEVSSELADTFVYLLMLADRLGIDLITTALQKMDVNERKYPVEKARGSNKKYTEL